MDLQSLHDAAIIVLLVHIGSLGRPSLRILQLVYLHLQLPVFFCLHLLVNLEVSHDLRKFFKLLVHFHFLFLHPVQFCSLLIWLTARPGSLRSIWR